MLYCNSRCQKRWRKHPTGVQLFGSKRSNQAAKDCQIGCVENIEGWKWKITHSQSGALWTLESAQFSACDNFSWETWERQAGRQAGKQGGKGLGKTDTPSNKGKQAGRQAERQAGRQGRQDLGKVGAPSNKGKQEGRQWETREGGHTIQQRETRRETRETRPREAGHTIQQRETRRDTRGDKASGRRTHHPTQTHMWGDNGTQGETRPRERGETIQHRHTCGETMRDNGRQDLGKARFPPSLTPPPSSARLLLTHNLLTHTTSSCTTCPHTTCPQHNFTHTELPHTQLVTHNLLTQNFLTHNLSTHTYWHTTSSHTHNLLTHNLLTHNLLTHNLSLSHTHNLLTQLVHTRLTHTHTTCSHTHNFLTHNLALGDIALHFAWQARHLAKSTLGWLWWRAWVWQAPRLFGWQALHLVTSTFTLRGRCGVGRAWRLRRWAGSGRARLGLAIAPAVGMAGMALGDIDLHFAWQVWHLATWTLHLAWQVWRLRHWAGSGGALGSGVRRGCLRGRRCTWWHRPSLCVAGVALGDMDLHFAWQAWHLRHWAGSGGALGSGGRRGCLRGRRGTWWHRPSLGDKGRQDLGKADKPSNTGIHVGRQGETRPREGGHTIQHRHTCGGTMGDKGRPREGGHTIQHQGGHLKKALRTRNSTLFGEKLISSTGTEPRNNRKHIVWYLLVNYIQHISPSYSHQNSLYPHQNVFVAKGSCCRSFSWRSNFFTSSRWHCQTKLVHRAHSDSDAFGAKSWLGDLKNWYMVDMVKGFSLKLDYHHFSLPTDQTLKGFCYSIFRRIHNRSCA